jgi:hypothetical protein
MYLREREREREGGEGEGGDGVVRTGLIWLRIRSNGGLV